MELKKPKLNYSLFKQGYVIRWISNSVNYSKMYDDMCDSYCFEINRPQG